MRYNAKFHDPANVVVPLTCTWDKLAALCLHVLVVRGTTFDRITIRFEDEFCDERGNPSIDAIPANFYDVDVRQRYNRTPEFGSATHREAITNNVGNIPGVGHLVGLMNENNRTANLKNRYRRSLVKLIREMYEVEHNVSFLQHRRNVLGLFIAVMETYFAAAARDLDEIEAMENPFTVDGYGDMLALLGNDRPTILEILVPIKRALTQAQTRHRKAVGRAQDATVRVFEIPATGGGQPAELHLLDSDDRKIAGPYFQAHGGANNPSLGILLIHGSDGSYALFTQGVWDLSGLATILNEVEPGRWHFERRYRNAMLLNGSGSRAGVASELKPMQLVELIRRNAVLPIHIQERAERRA